MHWDLEKGLAQDSQPKGGYLELARGKAQDPVKNGSQKEEAYLDKVSPKSH